MALAPAALAALSIIGRVCPSFQLAPASDTIQGVEAVEVGGSCRRLVGVSLGGSGGAGVGWLAPWLPSVQLAPARSYAHTRTRPHQF